MIDMKARLEERERRLETFVALRLARGQEDKSKALERRLCGVRAHLTALAESTCAEMFETKD